MFNLANKLLNKCNHSCLGSKCTLKKYLPHKCSVSSIIAKEIKLILKYSMSQNTSPNRIKEIYGYYTDF